MMVQWSAVVSVHDGELKYYRYLYSQFSLRMAKFTNFKCCVCDWLVIGFSSHTPITRDFTSPVEVFISNKVVYTSSKLYFGF